MRTNHRSGITLDRLLEGQQEDKCKECTSVIFSTKFRILVGGLVVFIMLGIIFAQFLPKPQHGCKFNIKIQMTS